MTGTHGVRANADAGRYELTIGDETAIAAFRRNGDVLVFTHTEVPEPMQGRGVASRLIAGALQDVREHGWRIVPACSFVADYLDRHPDDRDLLAR